MAKLYAELTSDKGGRVVGKGGDDTVTVTITHTGRPLWEIQAGAHGLLTITHNGKTVQHNALNF